MVEVAHSNWHRVHKLAHHRKSTSSSASHTSLDCISTYTAARCICSHIAQHIPCCILVVHRQSCKLDSRHECSAVSDRQRHTLVGRIAVGSWPTELENKLSRTAVVHTQDRTPRRNLHYHKSNGTLDGIPANSVALLVPRSLEIRRAAMWRLEWMRAIVWYDHPPERHQRSLRRG